MKDLEQLLTAQDADHAIGLFSKGCPTLNAL
jgi:hypothetical protein